jgi:hypothetical protein
VVSDIRQFVDPVDLRQFFDLRQASQLDRSKPCSYVLTRDQPASNSGIAGGGRRRLCARWITSPEGLRMVWEQES